MKNSQIIPKSLPGIKRIATEIARAEGVTHTQALNLVSRRAGFTDYQHAFAALEKTKQSASGQSERAVNRKITTSDNLTDFALGMQIHRDGERMPGFDGGNAQVISGWLAGHANVSLQGDDTPPRLYSALVASAEELTRDREWVECWTHECMRDLADLAPSSRAGHEIREFADRMFSDYASSVAH